jgi:hypothetical protein
VCPGWVFIDEGEKNEISGRNMSKIRDGETTAGMPQLARNKKSLAIGYLTICQVFSLNFDYTILAHHQKVAFLKQCLVAIHR